MVPTCKDPIGHVVNLVQRSRSACNFLYLRDRSLFMDWGGGGNRVQKWGGHRKYFYGKRVGIGKILRSPEGASKFFVNLQYPCDLQSNMHKNVGHFQSKDAHDPFQ